MDNAATLLNQLLIAWEAGRESATKVRGIREDDLASWHRQARAVELVREVERSIDGLEAAGHEVSSYREALPEWYELAFSYPRGWTAVRAKDDIGFSTESSRMLRALATLINVVDGTRSFDGAGLIEALAEAESLAREELGLTDTERRYILALIVEARRCVEDVDTFGYAEARRLTVELGGALVASYGDKRVSDATQKRLKDVLMSLFSKIGWKSFDKGLEITSSIVEKAIEQ